jgi:drug/metabolite transporter (DMT)-like permease
VSRSSWVLPLAVAVAILAWSSAWVCIRVAVAAYSPGQLALGRYLVASSVLLPVALARRPRFERRDWPLLVFGALCGFTLYNLAINAGERTITAGAASLIASTIPIFTTIGASLFLGEKIKPTIWFGSAVALGGVVLIAWGEKGGIGLSPGALLVVGAALCSAAYGLIQKRLLVRYAALDITSVAIFIGTVLLLPFGGGLVNAVRHAPMTATLNLVLLGVYPGAIGYVLWAWCLSQMPVARLMVFLYLVAPLSVLLGWAFLGELPSGLALFGGALALGGVIYSNLGARKKR